MHKVVSYNGQKDAIISVSFEQPDIDNSQSYQLIKQSEDATHKGQTFTVLLKNTEDDDDNKTDGKTDEEMDDDKMQHEMQRFRPEVIDGH